MKNGFSPINVEFDSNFLAFALEKFGKVQTPSLCDTTRYVKEGISSWGIELPNCPTSDVIKYSLTLASGSLRRQSVIQIVGGAAGFDKKNVYSPEYIDSIIDAYPPDPWLRSALDIFRAASAKRSTIVTGGTQVGIMALISGLYVTSHGMYKNIKTSFEKFVSFLSEPIQIIDTFVPPQLIHVVPAELTVFPGNTSSMSWDKGPELLGPCTGFISIPGIKDWGDDGKMIEENAWWASYTPSLEKVIGVFSSESGQVNRVTVVFNGGMLTLGEIYSAMINDAKIILINGSGRLADLLTDLLNNDWDLEKVKKEKMKEILLSDFNFDEFCLLLKRFCGQAKKKNNVYSHNLRTIGLKSLIEILLSGYNPRIDKVETKGEENKIEKRTNI